MPLTERDVVSALRPVDEPRLRRSVVDLGLVTQVSLSRRRVGVTLAMPVPGSEVALRRAITLALGALPGLDRVELDLRPTTEVEDRAVAAVLRGGGASADATDGNPLAVLDAGAEPQPVAKVNPFTDTATRVLAIASGKGGVGKSSVTTNLAIALAQRGREVAAVDADVWGFSMPRMLGIREPPALIDDVIVPPEAHGVRLISMGFFAAEDQPVIWRGPMLHKALEQFLTDVHWGRPEYLVVDMPPGTGDVALSMTQFLPKAEFVIVTTPQPAAQRVAQRSAYMARKVNLAVVGVIENMSWFRGDDGTQYELFGRGGGQELADELDVPLLGQVPLVSALREGGDDGHPIVVTDPGDEAAVAFRTIAERLDTEIGPRRVYHSELKVT